MNDSELDALIRRFGDAYNRPPDDPPLEAIRGRIHQSQGRLRRRHWAGIGALAVAAAVLVTVALRTGDVAPTRQRVALPTTDTNALSPTGSIDLAVARATEALEAAEQSAQVAARQNPGDSFFREHLETMRANSEHFRRVQQRQLGGIS